MREVTVGDTEILVVRVGEEYFAMGAKCSHYGAPLADGALHGHKVMCPWHHACFDVRDGAQLESPGMDSLPAYAIEKRDDGIYLTSTEPVERKQNQPDPATADQTFIIVGGGAAGAYAVEAIRQQGFAGKVLLISADGHYPYDRPNCSKDYLSGDAQEEWMQLRAAEFYKQHDIEVRLNCCVNSIDTEQHLVLTEDEESIRYDKVLVCTGASPRQLPLEGAQSSNVYTLRSWADSEHIRDQVEAGTKVVVIGASFIGLEGAMSLRKLGAEVTVIAPEKVPFEKLFGKEVGRLIQDRHTDAGIEFVLGTGVKQLVTEGDRVTTVHTENGKEIATDLVMVGIGVEPNTEFIQGVSRQDDKGVEADAYLQIAPNAYAAGDVVHFPHEAGLVRIEHWKVATQQGRIAGRNMAGAQEPYQFVPFFWTAQQGLNLRYVGHANGWDDVQIDGDLTADQPTFIARYFRNGKLQAALGCGKDQEMAALQLALQEELEA